MSKIEIYCQDDQHYHKGQKIKYLMVKQDMGSIKKRLFCDECFLGNYNSYQQYCCNLQELIDGSVYEAFKYTKFDSDIKQQYFNYARNHNPYLNNDFIENMISSFQEEILSLIEDLKTKFLEQSQKYLEELKKWTSKNTVSELFECDDLKMKLLNKKFERSPQNFEELNQFAESFVKKINNPNNEMKNINIEDIVSKQKQFFNLEKFNATFNEVIKSIQIMQETTFSDYKFSQSTLATPYIEDIVKIIAPEKEEIFFKDLKRIYRMTLDGSNYQALQKLDQILNSNTNIITIIQTKNKCVFGVYNCKSSPEKSILFQMNKEKYFYLKKDKKALQLNLKADLNSWIINIGEGDIVINSTFTKCTSNLGTGFDISKTDILNNKEYLSNCEKFDIYDMEIFQSTLQQPPQQPPQLPPQLPSFQQPPSSEPKFTPQFPPPMVGAPNIGPPNLGLRATVNQPTKSSGFEPIPLHQTLQHQKP